MSNTSESTYTCTRCGQEVVITDQPSHVDSGCRGTTDLTQPERMEVLRILAENFLGPFKSKNTERVALDVSGATLDTLADAGYVITVEDQPGWARTWSRTRLSN